MNMPVRYVMASELKVTGQSGMALIVSLVFLLLLTLLGISSMQNANLQEKMAGSVSLRNVSFPYRRLILSWLNAIIAHRLPRPQRSPRQASWQTALAPGCRGSPPGLDFI
jgi:hypothetical protein